MTAFSAKLKFGTITGDESNRLINVDRKPIFSTTPSTIFSTLIQSPFWNLFSNRINIPDIRFLNKSCAPSATATLKSPRPASIGPTLMPHSSKTAAAPITNIKNFKILTPQSIKSFVSTSPRR